MTHTILREEAEQIIAEIDLPGLLCRHGRGSLVGSVALDLVVKRDIDFVLLTETPELLTAVDALYHELLELEAVREVRISDYRREGGVKIGIDAYPAASGPWSIDIWVTDRLETSGVSLAERLSRELQAEHRAAILEIKHAYHQHDLLRDGMSRQIYLAVLDHGVRTLDQFQHFREEVSKTSVSAGVSPA